MRAAAAGFSSLFEEKGIGLSIEIDPVTAEADPDRIEQVVASLLSNALKHTRRGGRVSVRLQQAGPWAVIEVADTGRGIPGEDLPRIFERFYRGRRPRGRGSGIGLAVVRELAEAHGGRAMVESPAGSGAVFRVVIPAQPPGVREAGVAGVTRPAGVATA